MYINVVLSLFDGMSCGHIALTELGIIPRKYYASEVDKYAISQTALNFPDTIHVGDVRFVKIKGSCGADQQSILESIGYKFVYVPNLLIGGSPCQSFSFAGKRKGMSTKCSEEIYSLERYLQLKDEGFEFEGQSYLFWEYMRLLTEARQLNPDVLFLLENVEMGTKWERTLSEAIGVFGVHINSALVSAQNRKRIYWTNIRTRKEGLFGDLFSDIPQPKDRGILLRDILESDVDEKYYLSDKMLNYFDSRAANFNNGKVNIRHETDKATTITASCKSVDISDNFVLGTNLQPKTNQDKSSCFTAGGNSGGKQPYQQNRVYDSEGISPALCANKADLLIKQNYAVIGDGYEQDNRAYFEDGKSGTLDLKSESRQKVLLNNYRIRRLTPTECARLQTIPDWYKWEMAGQFNKIVCLCINNNCKNYNVCQNVKLTDAQMKSTLNKLNCAGSITSNNRGQVLWKQEGQLLINQNYASQKGVIDTNKQKKVIALCTISDLNEQEVILSQLIIKEIESVHIAIKKLGNKGQMECVHRTSKCIENMETRYMLKTKEVFREQEGIFEIEMELQFTEKFMKIFTELNLKKEKLFIILTALKPIIESVIYTYAKVHPNTHICIQNLDISSEKELTCHILSLRMENTYTSDSSIYKLLGNGWTVAVIMHIFSFIPKSIFSICEPVESEEIIK